MTKKTLLWMILLAGVAFARPDKKIALEPLAQAKLDLLQCQSQLVQLQAQAALKPLGTQANEVVAQAMKTQGLDPAKYEFKDGAFVPRTTTTTTTSTTLP